MSTLERQAQRWSVDPHVRFRKVLDEAVLIHQDKAEVIVLNETGYHFLEGCRKGESLREIAENMLQHFDVELATLEQDLLEWSEEMERRGIIHRADH